MVFLHGGQLLFLVAIGFWGHRGSDACIFVARLLVVARRAVVGGRRWHWALACRGTNLRLHRLVATSVLRGLPAFLSLERVLSSVVLAFLSPRSVVGVGRARCNSARRAAGFACVCFAMRRRACCGAYPLFIARARFVRFRRFYRRAWPWGPVGFATAPRAWAAVGICVDRRDAEAAGGGVVGSCGRTAPLRARAFGGFFSPPAWVEVHLAASQCWKTVRVRPAVCSQVRLVGSLVDCCTLRAVGRRSCVARGPSSCGGRGTS